MIKMEKRETFGIDYNFLQNKNENENGEMKSFGNECFKHYFETRNENKSFDYSEHVEM